MVGGAQRLIADIVSRLDAEQFEIHVITLLSFPERHSLYALLPKHIVLHKRSFRSLFAIPEWIGLYLLVRRLHLDVVFANLFFTSTVMGVLQLICHYRLFTVIHNTYIHKTSFEIFVDRLLSGAVEKYVAVSPTVASFTSHQENLPTERFVVIRNGLDVAGLGERVQSFSKAAVKEELGFPADARVVVQVARMTPQKRQHLLIEGFERFYASHPEYRLVLVGGGGMEEEIRTLVRKRKLDESIRIEGNQLEVAKYYAVAEFFASTSEIEGFGLAHAEALASGVPLVSTKTAGPDEMLREGENGFFITDETPKGVCEAFTRMHEAGPATMREAAKQTARRYDITETVHAYERLITTGTL